jgi:hypothetical protein
MRRSDALYPRLHATVRTIVTVSHRKHGTTWVWRVVGVLLGHAPVLRCIAK